MALTPAQNDALQQLWTVTNSSTSAAKERDERLLRENGWNVQATVEQIFSLGEPTSSSAAQGSSSSSTSGQATTGASHPEADDEPLLPRMPAGARRLSGSQRGQNRSSPGTAGVGLGFWGLITWPVSMLVTIVGGVWYFLIRTVVPLSLLPRLPHFLLPPSSPSYTPRPRAIQDPTTTSLHFVRDLELFTRCSSTSGTLPEFYVGPYREFISTLRKEGKLGAVLLVSSEHEDDEEFKRDVLCDPELIRFLKEKEILLWGADISSREGYQVSQTLLSTTYPSITFLSLLPAPSSPQPRLTILSTISGPPAGPLSATSILQSLTTSILPRTAAFLARLKRERLSLEEARHLRAEQDRAFADAERRDRERVASQRRAEEAERAERQRQEAEARDKELSIQRRAEWRRYARKHLLPPSEGSLRIALRTPKSPERHIRLFNPGPSTIPLYIYAETLLIPEQDRPETDPDTPPRGYQPTFDDFKIVTAYPRKDVQRVEQGGEEIWGIVKSAGGALFAEKVDGSNWGDDGEQDSDEEIIE